jgi:hypothetical protein
MPSGPPVPERYARFAACDWPGMSCGQAVSAWHQARTAWAAGHSWLEGETVISPLGDWLDMLVAVHETRMTVCCTAADDGVPGSYQ